MENLEFLFAAYSLTWIVLFGYLVIMWRKQNRLEKGMQQLKEKVNPQ